MASIRKRGKKWQAEVRLKGQYTSKIHDSKIEAQAWAVEKEIQFTSGAGIIRGKTLNDAFKRYGREVSITKKGARWEIIRLEKFGRYPWAHIQLADLDKDDINAWKNSELKRVQPSTVSRELNLLSSVLEFARTEWKWIATNPVKDVKRPKLPPPRDKRYSDDQIERISIALGYEEDQPIKTQQQEVAVAFLLALESAMRQGEIWGMEWQHVDLDKRTVHLPETKNGHTRDVPLTKRAVALLKKLQERDNGSKKVFRYKQQSGATLFRRAVKNAEIHDLTFHDTRHEALTRLAKKLHVLALARMVGHRDTRSLMIYYNATAAEIALQLD